MKRKAEEIKESTKPCVCEIHIKMDLERKSTIPCIGHGKGCICYEKAQQLKKDENKSTT